MARMAQQNGASARKEPPTPPLAPAADEPVPPPAPFALKDPRDFYRTLRLAAADMTALPSDDDVKEARHRAALEHHPDKPGGSHEQMQRLNEAFDFLVMGASLAAPPLDLAAASR